jgi:membrane-associated phospholipid phosphatase
MFNKLINFDKWLFSKINQSSANSFFDTVLPFFREPLSWIPLYLFFIIYAIYNFPKKALSWIIGMGLTAASTDLISSRIIKPLIGRKRPCNDLEIADTIRLLLPNCGQNGSFTSSHAANHFGIAMFIYITMKDSWGNYTYLFFLWAALISYAQVYVGVHFPFDIIGGAILGCAIGYCTAKVFTQKIGSPSVK